MGRNNGADIDGRVQEIERLIADFKEKFEAGTVDAERFITMHEIERMWGELRGNTNNIYSDMVQDLMGSVDEAELIRKKKENTGTGG
jgi:hypothetical protein